MTQTLAEPDRPAVAEEPVVEASLTGEGVRTAEEYRSLAESLSQSVMRVHVKVCRWRGLIPLPGATVEYNGTRLTEEDGVKAQPFPVMPDTWKRRFATLENTIRSVVKRRCIQIYAYNLGAAPVVENEEDGGAEEEQMLLSSDNIVDMSSKDALKAELDEIVRTRWNPLVEEFVTAYPQILVDRKAAVSPAIREAIDAHALTQEAVRARFRVIFMPLPLGVRADDLTVAALQEGAGDYLVALRESLVRQTLGNLRTASENLMGKIRERGVVRGGTLESVERALSRLRSFASALDVTELDSQLAAAEELLKSTDPREVNQSSRHGVGDIAERINAALVGIVREADAAGIAGGRGVRRVGA